MLQNMEFLTPCISFHQFTRYKNNYIIWYFGTFLIANYILRSEKYRIMEKDNKRNEKQNNLSSKAAAQSVLLIYL